MKYVGLTLWAVMIFLTPACGRLRDQTLTPAEVDLLACSEYRIASVEVLLEQGGNIDWSPDGEWIAYDTTDDEDWTHTWKMRPDGSQKTCLTCDATLAPTPLHLGNPAWHPSMNWLVVQGVPEQIFESFPSDDQDYKQRIMDIGVGIGNELWAMSPEGSQFVQLTDVFGESGFEGGVLHAHFSQDGSLLAWSQRVGWVRNDPSGEWAIMIADFVEEEGTPRLENIRRFQPGTQVIRLFETHTFSPDDRLLLYTGNSDGQQPHGYDIYTLDPVSGNATQLTETPRHWDEHAHFSPDGECVVWISSMNANAQSPSLLKTELWIMSADGRSQTQLSYFNHPESSMYMTDEFGVVPADISWSPTGDQLALYVIVNQSEESTHSMPGRTVLVTFEQ